MAKQGKIILYGDKLLTTRDIYLDGKLIPAGTIFYAVKTFEDNYREQETVKIFALAGFGHNLTLGICVNYQAQAMWSRSCLFLPLDALQLAE